MHWFVVLEYFHRVDIPAGLIASCQCDIIECRAGGRLGDVWLCGSVVDRLPSGHKGLGLIPQTTTAKNKVLYYFCHIDLISTNDVMGTGRKYRNIIRVMHLGYLLL